MMTVNWVKKLQDVKTEPDEASFDVRPACQSIGYHSDVMREMPGSGY